MYRVSFVSVMALTLLLSCWGEGAAVKDDDYLSTTERPAVSPSGKFILKVVGGEGERKEHNRFEIWERTTPEGEKPLHSSQDWFSTRHTTYFLWDKDDRVWVYSGDVGTFYWTRQQDGSWKKHIYAEEKIPPPDYLKKKRPQFFQVP